MLDRRQLLQGLIAGMLMLAASPWAGAGQQTVEASPVQHLSDTIAVVNVGGSNVVVFSTDESAVLVDSGAAGHGDELMAALDELTGSADVHTLFNTHYHLENTGNNARFGREGTTIIAHDRTHQWMSTDYWLPGENRYEPARPEAAWPTETFIEKGSIEAAGERIDYGYLLMAHTGGDIYVYFRDSNVLAVGGVASPAEDPSLDWISGGWIGGRLDAMDLLLELANEDTLIVPGTGPVMTYAEFRDEREVMEIVRQRLFTRVRAGEGPQDMLDAGAMDGLERTWDDPYKFLYDAARGLWGNHNKLDPDGI